MTDQVESAYRLDCSQSSSPHSHSFFLHCFALKLSKDARGDLARTMGMRVVAVGQEFLEINRQLDLLQKSATVSGKILDKLLILDRKHRIKDRIISGATFLYDQAMKAANQRQATDDDRGRGRGPGRGAYDEGRRRGPPDDWREQDRRRPPMRDRPPPDDRRPPPEYRGDGARGRRPEGPEDKRPRGDPDAKKKGGLWRR